MERYGADSGSEEQVAEGEERVSAERLPPELWLRILELATDIVPGAVETETLDPFQPSAPLPMFEDQAALLRSLAIKRSLVRVCRQWRALATPFLYRIVIAKGQQLSLLHRTLIAPDAPDHADRARSLRKYVLRLFYFLNQLDHDYDSTNLAAVILALPNLISFTLRGGVPTRSRTDPHESVLSALKERGPTLRVLDWVDCFAFTRSSSQMRELLSDLAELRILRQGPLPPVTANSTQVSLPKLVVLAFDPFMSSGSFSPAFDNFASLRELQLQETAEFPYKLPAPVAAQITQVTIWFSYDYQAVQDIIRIFPNLRHLVIWYGVWYDLPPNGFSLCNVECLGLGRYGRREVEDDGVLNEFLDCLSVMDPPKLTLLRFLGTNEWPGWQDECPQTWARFQRLAGSSKYRIENSLGEVVH
ncbi:hypothetical protein GLOTRDRAFT_133670 [Gloeophyllum trabeum ATCC 11539]|uniref:Uncharacterized protein n=1 Tax=Gloeophyllum trabeum (strain ATCC 11539 / FP-39264 / Madison 617) TaxID=670483 RepID=S7PUC9_GLOTA|nr:uncharacterized protein GLOTRDRAFT_133670 [Gloeophyllum trabeum ATCC 11539]EPQ50932.1 hypothetical protein GLOTRDRAFT_133670 [Gloeophyllum trabeum ATCC 11539]